MRPILSTWRNAADTQHMATTYTATVYMQTKEQIKEQTKVQTKKKTREQTKAKARERGRQPADDKRVDGQVSRSPRWMRHDDDEPSQRSWSLAQTR
jgi:hypothetical protein